MTTESNNKMRFDIDDVWKDLMTMFLRDRITLDEYLTMAESVTHAELESREAIQ